MKSLAGTLAAPFPWFGGKSLACADVWAAFGDVDNYVEPFAGSAAMLLGAPEGKRVEGRALAAPTYASGSRCCKPACATCA